MPTINFLRNMAYVFTAKRKGTYMVNIAESANFNMTAISNGIYISNNPWGYRININHPYIKPFYERFKRWKGIHGAPSDEERKEFEAYMGKYLSKENRRR